MEPITIVQKAKEALFFFTTKKRKPDDDQEIVIAKDGAPGWIGDLSHEAHRENDGGYMFPDDFRYQFLVQALDAINEHEDRDAARDSLEADIYNSDLTAWLHSNNGRLGYVDDAAQEMGKSDTCPESNRLQCGQLMEKWEVFDAVYSFLEDLVEDANDAENE